MQLSTERPRARWMVLSLVWIVVAGIALADALAMGDYVKLLDDSGTLSTDSLPLVRSVPADYADAKTWVRYALAVQAGAPWRLRHTDIDNAPNGRDVHWNSTFAHLVSAAGRIQRAATGAALPRATEAALAWFNLPLFMSVVVIFSVFVTRRAGAAAGTLIALAMIGHRWFYFGFAPNYVDHHGLLTAASFGVVLGAVFMGAGWWRPDGEAADLLPTSRDDVRAAAILSGVSGAIGLWISAASIVPTIAFVGIAGAAAGWLWGPAALRQGAEFDASAWRVWGRTGGGLALVAYLLEYAPHHMAMRLEVNHPLYALAWFAGGELVAMVVEWRVRVRAPAWRIALAALAVTSPLIAIAVGGSAVFIPFDPRIARVHSGIAEFFSVAMLARAPGGQSLGRFAIGFVLALPAVLVLRPRQKHRVLVGFVAIVVLASVAMACWQMRWWLSASGPELCLLLVAVAAIARDWSARARWGVVLGIGALFVEQSVARIVAVRDQVDAKSVDAADAMEPLYRDIAATIRASQPTGDVVLLTNPNASTGIGYFGRFKTLGTLYWENLNGLAAAAAIFSARTDDSARALMRAHGVTHVALLSKDDFLRGYFAFAEPASPRDEINRTFGYRLMATGSVPRWLRLLPFRLRAGTPSSVILFQVVPDQPDFDARWNVGTARLAMDQTEAAERALREAIALASPERRVALYETAAATAYQGGAHALALRFYQSAVTIASTPTIRTNMAWILATSVDDGVRDGHTALSLVEPLARAYPSDSPILDAYAAALAELGRFSDAVAVARRMRAIAQDTRNTAAEARADSRIDLYSRARPWRQ